jgi:hypothetical protein
LTQWTIRVATRRESHASHCTVIMEAEQTEQTTGNIQCREMLEESYEKLLSIDVLDGSMLANT